VHLSVLGAALAQLVSISTLFIKFCTYARMVHVSRLARTLFVMGSPGRALRHPRPQATQLDPRLGV